MEKIEILYPFTKKILVTGSVTAIIIQTLTKKNFKVRNQMNGQMKIQINKKMISEEELRENRLNNEIIFQIETNGIEISSIMNENDNISSKIIYELITLKKKMMQVKQKNQHKTQ